MRFAVLRLLWCRAPNGVRTRVSALKGRRPRPLDDGGVSPERTGLRGQPTEYSQVAGAQPRAPKSGGGRPGGGPCPRGTRARVARRGRGTSRRRGDMVRTATTRKSRSSRAAAIGKAMPKVWTLRHRRKSIAWPGGSHPRLRRPRMRSRRVVGVSTTQRRRRGSINSSRCIRRPYARAPTSVGLAGFEPATRGLKAPCSNLAELQALRTTATKDARSPPRPRADEPAPGPALLSRLPLGAACTLGTSTPDDL